MKIRGLTIIVCATLAAVSVTSTGGIGPAGAWAKKRAASPADAELAIGRPAPKADVKLADVSGRPISLREARGKKGLLVIFSCNTCPFVLAWEDRYQTIAEQAGKTTSG